MGVDVQVRTETDEVIETFDDPKSVIARLMDRAYVAQLPYLRFVDRYGNTYFNKLQLEAVIPEVRQLSELAETDEEKTYQIVGDLEADIKQRLIAVNSPLARALIGKSEGDSFEFQAPNGMRSYEILSVRYGD